MGNTSSQASQNIHPEFAKLDKQLSPSSFETSDETQSEKDNSTNSISKERVDMIVTNIPTTMPETTVKSPKSPMSKGSRRSGAGRKMKSPKNDDTRDDEPPTSTKIKDEQVLVNLAMADLMAYLQVVANNSNNLPLTRRDDPELSRTVTTLTSEEYARKSAAFIPADVRVISGSFLKYGNVWDLPTSEEYVASDGAQEPGRSYGGACTNSMLKVLYDAASEAVDAVQPDENGMDSLFDDDDDESLATLPLARNSTFASLDMNGQSNPSTISWAELLRKMKTEIKDIEYVQLPTIGSTRKFDLNKSFSLVPESFDKTTGKKRSLLVGCNYLDTEGAELKASHDDICSMKDYIVNVHGFSESEDMMTVLLDDGEHQPPTFMNIVEAFKSLSEQSQPGDAVFVQFSGHGGRVLDSPINNSVESYDEILVPSDYSASGVIRDTLIFKTLLAPMRYGVTVTIIVDACDTGMRLDLPYAWSTRNDRSGSTAKMKQCEDFSFVRFLKVVKTLYESSTFTQLGKTVGSALGQQSALEESDDEEGGATADEKTDSEEPIRQTKTEEMQGSGGLLRALCSPRNCDVNAVDKATKGDALGVIEKMLGCNFLVQDIDGDFSYDDDTYANRTFDDTHMMTHDSTFDSMSEGEYRRAMRRRSRRR